MLSGNLTHQAVAHRANGRLRAGRAARLVSETLSLKQPKEGVQVTGKHPGRLNWERFRQLAELLIRAVEPVARLIDAISRLR